MRNLKLSFALVVAIMAVGFTLATNASAIGKKVLTDCFQITQIALINQGGSQQSTISDSQPVAQVDAALLLARYLNQDITVTAVPDAECPFTDLLCCVKFEEDASASVTPRSINGGTPAKWKVEQVLYKN